MSNYPFERDEDGFPIITPESTRLYQWAEFEIECQHLAKTIYNRGPNADHLRTELVAMYQDRGGTSEDYLVKQARLNEMWTEATNMPLVANAAWVLPESDGTVSY